MRKVAIGFCVFRQTSGPLPGGETEERRREARQTPKRRPKERKSDKRVEWKRKKMKR